MLRYRDTETGRFISGSNAEAAADVITELFGSDLKTLSSADLFLDDETLELLGEPETAEELLDMLEELGLDSFEELEDLLDLDGLEFSVNFDEDLDDY